MKKRYRMLICFALVLLLLLPVGVQVHADTDPQPNEELKQAIIESCIYNRKIDVSQFDITLEELNELFYTMLDRGDLPWYTERRYFNYEYDEQTLQALSFEPKLLPASQYDRAFYQQRLEEILGECVIDGMEPWQIALSVHDYLIVHGYYDESLNDRTGYDLLDSGRTVCTGYTEVYRELMNLAGIPCVSVVSDPMLHTWNLVQLDGNWYHVDVTWDDPTPDSYGRARHEFFLLTDEEISAVDDPHYDWETDITCTDTAYSDAFWRDVDSPIVFTDADTCFLIRDKKLSNGVYKRTLSTGKETSVYKEKSEFLNIGKGSYRYQHYGLSLWNGRLWVSTMTKVLSMKLNGSDLRTEFTYDAKKYKRFLSGFYVYNDTLRYTTLEHSGYPEKRKEELAATGYHVHEYTQTVVEPTCGVAGYTVSECSCGIRCQSTPTYQLEHEFVTAEDIAPTLWQEGIVTERCTHCGEEHSQVLPKVEFADFLAENMQTVAVCVGAAVVVVAVTVALILKAIFRKKKKTAVPEVEQQE